MMRSTLPGTDVYARDLDTPTPRARRCRFNTLTSTDGLITRIWLLPALGRDGLVHCLVDAEDLRQPGDPEDLQDLLPRADQVQRAVVRPDPLQAPDQHPEAGGVEEPDLLQVDDELVVVPADQIDEQLTQPRRRIDIDLAR